MHDQSALIFLFLQLWSVAGGGVIRAMMKVF